MLTARNLEVLRAIAAFREEHGYSPSFRELGQELYLSPGAVQRHITKLINLGYISMIPNAPRTIVVRRK